MPRAVIVANGKMETPPDLASLLRDSDVVIAADGGVHNCKLLDLQPAVIIGDLDSIGADEEGEYQAAGIQLIRFPAKKDETDLELALQYAARNGMDEAIVLGALGARWDMTFANVMLAAHPRFTGLAVRFLDGSQELSVLMPGAPVTLRGAPGDTISLIPLGGEARGISTRGLEYPLNAESLQFGSPRGVSNVFVQESVQITFTQGVLLCVLDRNSS